MSVKDRDPLTGHQTTGHEWNGITELNTRVPRVVWFFILVTHLWALAVWVLLPAWPLVTTSTKGILGLDQREEVAKKVVAANSDRAVWGERIKSLSADEILGDPELFARISDTGPQLFGDNCAGCHGAQATGGPGFPNLIDGAWLWGGDTDTVMETLRVGINAPHPDTRWPRCLHSGVTVCYRATISGWSSITSSRFRGSNPLRTRLRRVPKFSQPTVPAATAMTAPAIRTPGHLTLATVSGSTAEMTKRCSGRSGEAAKAGCLLGRTV